MSKTIKFTDTKEDKALLKRIEKYKKENRISSYIETVRRLCDDALTLKKISK